MLGIKAQLINKEVIKMAKIEDKRIAKIVLANGGVKVFQKDIKNVIVHHINMESEDGEIFPHRIIYRVEMNNGVIYEAIQETVDNNGNFSLGSAKFITREIREIGR